MEICETSLSLLIAGIIQTQLLASCQETASSFSNQNFPTYMYLYQIHRFSIDPAAKPRHKRI